MASVAAACANEVLCRIFSSAGVVDTITPYSYPNYLHYPGLGPGFADASGQRELQRSEAVPSKTGGASETKARHSKHL